MGKHDEAWMVLKQIHDTNMRARGEPERVFTVSTRLLVPFPHCCSAVGGWQISVSPCRWTGLKSPSSWTSWWRCRMSQPTLCSRSSSRSRLSSEEYVWVVFFCFFLFPTSRFYHRLDSRWGKTLCFFQQIWLTFMKCFSYPVKDNTLKLAAVWFTLSFG